MTKQQERKLTKNIWQSTLTHKDITVESCERQYEGHFTLDKLVIKFKKFNDQWSRPVYREQISRGNAAAVLLYDPKEDLVVLVEQLRIGCIADKTIHSPWLLELVAGLVYPGEQAAETAIREAEEEAGVKLSELIPVCEYYNTPGALTEKTSIYCALVDASTLGGVFGLEEEDENIQVHVLPFDAIFAQLVKNQFLTSASTVIALQWLRLNRESIKKNKLDK
jgi:ADP-ribose pyrophosphatase